MMEKYFNLTEVSTFLQSHLLMIEFLSTIMEFSYTSISFLSNISWSFLEVHIVYVNNIHFWYMSQENHKTCFEV